VIVVIKTSISHLFVDFVQNIFCSFVVSNPLLNRERESRRDYPREDGVEQIRVKEEPPDGKYF